MEVEAAEVAGDVDDFADEEEAGDATGFHGFAGEFASVHAAARNFRFFVAFGEGGGDLPRVKLPFESGEGGIRVGARGVEFQPTCGEALREKFLEGVAGGGEIAAGGSAKRGGGVALGSEIELDRLAFVPVRGDLENRGAAEATMGEEHLLAKGILTGDGSNHVGGDTREFGIAMLIGAIEDERNKGRPSGNDVKAELTS